MLKFERCQYDRKKKRKTKACSQAFIPERFFKEYAHETSPCLLTILQRSLDTGQVPDKHSRLASVTKCYEYIPETRVTTYVIALMLLTLSTAPSLIYKVSFPLRKIKQMSVCTNKAVQAVPNITLEQNI